MYQKKQNKSKLIVYKIQGREIKDREVVLDVLSQKGKIFFLYFIVLQD